MSRPMRRHATLALLTLGLALAAPARAQTPNLTDAPDFHQGDNPNAEPKPNGVTISAYDPSLKNNEILELALAKQVLGWGKRGDIGLYFPGGMPDQTLPGGRRYFIVGSAAEEYIKKGLPMRGMTTVGMPVDDYGSATWAKNVSRANTLYAHKQARTSPLFQAAIKAVVQANPALKTPAGTLDLRNPGLVQALTDHARTDPSFATAWGTLAREMMIPTAFVVHGFPSSDRGSTHYGVHKRQANELGRATDDRIVAGKVADLMAEWWKKALPQARESGQSLRLFTANHCAGTYEDADWLQMLNDKLERQDPKLAREVMHRTYAYDFGAGANKPQGVHHLAQIGARDMFGHINTPTRVMAHADIVEASHMLNTGMGRANPDGLVALELKPFNEAFRLPALYASRPQGAITREKIAAQRIARLEQMAGSLRNLAAQKAEVQRILDQKSPAEDKRWETYRMTVANLEGHQAIYTARARRAEALKKVMELRGQGASKAQIGRAWDRVKQARSEEQQLRAEMERTIVRDLGFSRGTYNAFGPMFSPGFWTNSRQYQQYVHGEQPAAMQRHLVQRLGAAGVQKFQAQAQKADAVFKKQMVSFYGRIAAITQAVRQTLQQQQAGQQAGPQPAAPRPR